MTEDSGNVLWSWNSDAFGTTLPNEDVDDDSNDFELNLRLPGQYFDSESGNHYNYFRDYEPGTGRYLQSDPIGLEGGINSYVYVTNSPINLFDIYGLCPCDPNKPDMKKDCSKQCEDEASCMDCCRAKHKKKCKINPFSKGCMRSTTRQQLACRKSCDGSPNIPGGY